MVDSSVFAAGTFHIVDALYDENIPKIFSIGEMEIKGAFCLCNAQIKFYIQISVNLSRLQLELYFSQILFGIITSVPQAYLYILRGSDIAPKEFQVVLFCLIRFILENKRFSL